MQEDGSGTSNNNNNNYNSNSLKYNQKTNLLTDSFKIESEKTFIQDSDKNFKDLYSALNLLMGTITGDESTPVLNNIDGIKDSKELEAALTAHQNIIDSLNSPAYIERAFKARCEIAEYHINYTSNNERVSTNWKPNEKLDLKEVLEKFLFVQNQEKPEEFLTAVYRLNDELVVLVSDFLTKNYKLNNESNLNFRIKLPPDIGSKLIYRRQENIFSFELCSPISVLLTLSGDGLGLDFEKNIVSLPIDEILTHKGPEFCKISIIAKLDLTRFPEKRGSIEIDFSTGLSFLHYIGTNIPTKTAENSMVVNLKTIHHTDNIPTVTPKVVLLNQFLSQTTRIKYSDLIIELAAIQRTHKLTEKGFLTKDVLQQVLFFFGDLFENALTTRLARYEYYDIENNDSTDANKSMTNMNFELIPFIEDYKKNNQNFVTLICDIYNEFTFIFSHYTLLQHIVPLMKIFHNTSISEIKSYAQKEKDFFEKTYVKKEKSNTHIDKKITHRYLMHSLFIVALDALKKALKEKDQLEIERTQSYQMSTQEKTELANIYVSYITNADTVFNKLANVDALFNVDDVSNFKKFSGKTKRKNLTTVPIKQQTQVVDPKIPTTTAQTEQKTEAIDPKISTTNTTTTIVQIEETELVDLEVTAKKRILNCSSYQKVYLTLLIRNPFLIAFTNGLSAYYTAVPFARLFPPTYPMLRAYALILQPLFGVGGLYEGYFMTKNPNDAPPPVLKVFKITANTITVAYFSMGLAINTYLKLYPQAQNVQDNVFLDYIVPAPAAVCVLYAVWQTCYRNPQYTVNKILNLFFNIVLFGGVAENWMLYFSPTPGSWEDLLVPVVAGILLSALKALPATDHITALFMSLATASILGILLETDVRNNQLLPIELGYPTLITWAATLSGSIIFTIKNTVDFKETYDISVITRPIQAQQIKSLPLNNFDDIKDKETAPLLSNNNTEQPLVIKTSDLKRAIGNTDPEAQKMIVVAFEASRRNSSGRYLPPEQKTTRRGCLMM